MRIFVDYEKQKISKIEQDQEIYFGDNNVDVVRVLVNTTSIPSDFYVSLGAKCSNNRDVNPRLSDTLTTSSLPTETIDDVTYTCYDFTLSQSNGWYLSEGLTNFFVWFNFVDTSANKCVGSARCNIIASSTYYQVDNPVVSPELRSYLNDNFDEIKEDIEDEVNEIQMHIGSLASATPSIFDTTANILSLSEDKGVAVSTTDGDVYTWSTNESIYTDTGIKYQSTGLANAVSERISNGYINDVLFFDDDTFEDVDSSLINTGYYVGRSNGELNASSGSYYTDMIPLSIDDVYSISGNYWAFVCMIATYDFNGNFLRSYLNDSSTSSGYTNISNYNFTPASDEYFVRFSSFSKSLTVKHNKLSSKLMFDSGTIDYANANIIHKGGYVSTNGLITTDTNSYYTDMLKITDGDVFYVSLKYWARTVGIAVYDENRNFLRYYLSNNDSGSSSAVSVSNYEFTPASDEKYVRFGSYYSSLSVKKVGTLDIREKIIVMENEINSISESGSLNGKKYICFGDSITAGYNLSGYTYEGQLSNGNDNVNTYGKLVSDALGLDYHNYGLSASGFSATGNGTTTTTQRFYNLIDSYHPDADIITIAYGTNDYGLAELNEMPFGNLSDTSTDSFCGCVRTCFTKISTYYTDAEILIILPLPRWDMTGENSYGKTLEDYANAINDIAGDFGYPVLDLYHHGRVNKNSETFKNTYTFDGLHYNESFHKKYYKPIVQAFIEANRIEWED